MNTLLTAARRPPWYREPWPWFLASLPASAVVAGLVTVWIAATNSDGLVVGDYYKAGLAINQTLARDDAARAMNLAATVHESDGTLAVTLTGSLPAWPELLQLTLAHPTRPGMDRTLTLHHAGAGRYRAVLPPLAAGKWHVQIAGPQGNWRLAGVLHTPFDAAVTLAASHTPQPSQGD
ncbi:MAG: FixH family protein [Thiobacillus sp.]|nr:FixH family protein [Thiobacillus sp.]